MQHSESGPGLPAHGSHHKQTWSQNGGSANGANSAEGANGVHLEPLGTLRKRQSAVTTV